MSQPGRQQRQARLHVGAVAVPVEQGPYRKRVADVMQSRTALSWPGVHAGSVDEFRERALHVAGIQAGAAAGDQQCGARHGRT